MEKRMTLEAIRKRLAPTFAEEYLGVHPDDIQGGYNLEVDPSQMAQKSETEIRLAQQQGDYDIQQQINAAQRNIQDQFNKSGLGAVPLGTYTSANTSALTEANLQEAYNSFNKIPVVKRHRKQHALIGYLRKLSNSAFSLRVNNLLPEL